LRPKGFNNLLGAVRCMLEWALAQQLIEVSPLRVRRRRVTPQAIPYLFDQGQVRRLLDAAGRLPDNPRARGRAATYRTIFALCYGLGLRVGEACGLRVGDVDVQRRLLVVRGGKFGICRFRHMPKYVAA
jgi:integrase